VCACAQAAARRTITLRVRRLSNLRHPPSTERSREVVQRYTHETCQQQLRVASARGPGVHQTARTGCQSAVWRRLYGIEMIAANRLGRRPHARWPPPAPYPPTIENRTLLRVAPQLPARSIVTRWETPPRELPRHGPARLCADPTAGVYEMTSSTQPRRCASARSFSSCFASSQNVSRLNLKTVA
jgi:hypothetical protein